VHVNLTGNQSTSQNAERDMYIVLRHQKALHFTRIISAMLLGVIEPSRCIKLNAELLNDLLSFAVDAEEHRISSEWGYKVSLPCMRNILLRDVDADWCSIARAREFSGEKYFLCSGNKILCHEESERGLVPSGREIKSPAMTLEQIQTLLETFFKNLRENMQLILNILSSCKVQNEQKDFKDFIKELNSMRKKVSMETEKELKSLIDKVDKQNHAGFSEIVQPTAHTGQFSRERYAEMMGFLHTSRKKIIYGIDNPNIRTPVIRFHMQ
jgi:hypothetical protein